MATTRPFWGKEKKQQGRSTCEIRLDEIQEEFNQMRKRDLTKDEVEEMLQDIKYYQDNCVEQSI